MAEIVNSSADGAEHSDLNVNPWTSFRLLRDDLAVMHAICIEFGFDSLPECLRVLMTEFIEKHSANGGIDSEPASK